MEQSQAVKTFEELFAELRERARTRPDGSATVAGIGPRKYMSVRRSSRLRNLAFACSEARSSA